MYMLKNTFTGKLDKTAPLHVQFAVFLDKQIHAMYQVPPFVPIECISVIMFRYTIWMVNLQEDQQQPIFLFRTVQT